MSDYFPAIPISDCFSAIPMSDYFPAEVFNEILFRLPVKSLVRCTCVCKSWNSLITDPTFITTHLNRTTFSNIHESTTDLLLLRQFLGKHNGERYSLRRDNQTLDECALLDFPFQARGFGATSKGVFRIVGSCNGLLCLSDDLMGYTYVVILWNPSIRKSITLPRPNVTFNTVGPYSFALGFGFDAKSNDYKVVRLVFLQLSDDEAVPEVELYSLSTGAWRGISAAGAPYIVMERYWSQAFINGAVHWPAFCQNRENSNLILSFDLSDEVFRRIELPEGLVLEYGSDLWIAEFRGSLSVFTVSRKGKPCSVWVMREYGVAASWSKQFIIDLEGGVGKIISLRKNNEVLVATKKLSTSTNTGKLVSYHPETHQIMDLAICSKHELLGSRDSFYLGTYVESLVLLKKLNGVLRTENESGGLVTHDGAHVLSRNEESENGGVRKNEKTEEEPKNEKNRAVAGAKGQH